MRWMEPCVPWGCSHTGATHAAPEPPSSISVSNAWLFVTLCVRCGASVWRELQPRGAGGGQARGDGRKGDPGGEPELSSLLQAGGLAGTTSGTEAPLGTGCSLCDGQSVSDS